MMTVRRHQHWGRRRCLRVANSAIPSCWAFLRRRSRRPGARRCPVSTRSLCRRPGRRRGCSRRWPRKGPGERATRRNCGVAFRSHRRSRRPATNTSRPGDVDRRYCSSERVPVCLHGMLSQLSRAVTAACLSIYYALDQASILLSAPTTYRDKVYP